MARRKLEFMGHDLPDQFMYALGLNRAHVMNPVLRELDLDLPQLDWKSVGEKLTSDIPEDAKNEISELFENEFRYRLHSEFVNFPDSGAEISHSEF